MGLTPNPPRTKQSQYGACSSAAEGELRSLRLKFSLEFEIRDLNCEIPGLRLCLCYN